VDNINNAHNTYIQLSNNVSSEGNKTVKHLEIWNMMNNEHGQGHFPIKEMPYCKKLN
jgi:hypothetical protein